MLIKKKWLALLLTAITVFSLFACLTACDEKRGEEVTAEEWDTAFANLNTDYMIVEVTSVVYMEKGRMDDAVKCVFNEKEADSYGTVRHKDWDEFALTWTTLETYSYETAYKVVDESLFYYPICLIGETEGQWELKHKTGGQEQFNEMKANLFKSEYLLFDVFCLGIDMFTYDEEEGFYYKDWTEKIGEEEVKFHQEAVFKDGEVYEIYTTTNKLVVKDNAMDGESSEKITFEAEEITLPNEGELIGAILATKEK